MARVHAQAYARMDGVEIAGFFSRHRSRAAAMARAFGTLATTRLERLVRDDSIDALDVVVPSGVHRDPVVAALEAGKDVFCETPLALTLEDADAMLRAARRADRLLLCAQLMRFVPQYVHARATARSGRLGAPTLIVASRLCRPYWSAAEPRPFETYGEPVVELMIFDFNFLNWVLGRPRSVSARGLPGEHGAADCVVATVQYADALGVAEGCARMPPGFPFNTRLRVLFRRGLQEADFRIHAKGFSSSFVEFSRGSPGRTVQTPRTDPYAAECGHFVDCVRREAHSDLLDAAHDREALQVALAARRALLTGRTQPLRTASVRSGRP